VKSTSLLEAAAGWTYIVKKTQDAGKWSGWHPLTQRRSLSILRFPFVKCANFFGRLASRTLRETYAELRKRHLGDREKIFPLSEAAKHKPLSGT
jgi:hypothetical protein